MGLEKREWLCEVARGITQKQGRGTRFNEGRRVSGIALEGCLARVRLGLGRWLVVRLTVTVLATIISDECSWGRDGFPNAGITNIRLEGRVVVAEWKVVGAGKRG